MAKCYIILDAVITFSMTYIKWENKTFLPLLEFVLSIFKQNFITCIANEKNLENDVILYNYFRFNFHE